MVWFLAITSKEITTTKTRRFKTQKCGNKGTSHMEQYILETGGLMQSAWYMKYILGNFHCWSDFYQEWTYPRAKQFHNVWYWFDYPLFIQFSSILEDHVHKPWVANTSENLRAGPQPTYWVSNRTAEPIYQHKHGLLEITSAKDKEKRAKPITILKVG